MFNSGRVQKISSSNSSHKSPSRLERQTNFKVSNLCTSVSYVESVFYSLIVSRLLFGYCLITSISSNNNSNSYKSAVSW